MPRDAFGRLWLAAGAFALLTTLAAPTSAQDNTSSFQLGGDLFVTDPSGPVDAGRDVFAVGAAPVLSGSVAEDAHAVGFSVEVHADTLGDLYAAGGSVSVRGSVGSDLSATGGTVRTHASSTTQGNARLTGGSITIDGPVNGALMASGGDLFLNAPVGGDVRLSAGRIRFGPNAEVTGRLTYATSEPIDIPDSVADPTRVTFQQLDYSDFMDGPDGDWDWPDSPEMELGPVAAMGALAATIGSFLLVGAIFLAFTPNLVSRMRKGILARPGKTALSGLIGLSLLIGSVPILLMTLVGIPLVPIAILAVLIVWYLGYVLGAYSLGMGIARSLGMAEDPSIGMRLLVLAVVALVAALLNFIPFLGWLVNLGIVFLGVGAMTYVLFERLLPNSTAPDASLA